MRSPVDGYNFFKELKIGDSDNYWLSVMSGLSGNWGKTAFRLIEIVSMYFDTSLKTSRVDWLFVFGIWYLTC